jgi:hypothetical protein
LPVCFLVAFNYGVINRNLATWFRAPASNDLQAFKDAADLLVKEMGDETQAQAELLAAQPETRQLLLGGSRRPRLPAGILPPNELSSAAIFPLQPKDPRGLLGTLRQRKIPTAAPCGAVSGDRWRQRPIGSIAITALIPLNVAQKDTDHSELVEGMEPAPGRLEVRAHLLHAADGADHRIHLVRGRVDRAVPRQADQRPHHRSCWAPPARCAKATCNIAWKCARPMNWATWCAPSTA